MPHPEVRNRTRFTFVPLLPSDEEGSPQFAAFVQGCYNISSAGEITLLEDQPEPLVGGEWHGDPAISSMRLEPQIAFMKPATDIIMLGFAHAPRPGTTRMQVGIRVGQLQKLVNVTGDRRLLKTSGIVRVTDPEPFEMIPLIYERAFGGWDRRHENAERHRCEARNPVGVAFRDGSLETDDEFMLPNIEHPETPFLNYGDTPTPTGFGFIGPNWQPRAKFAGTFDADWDESRKPLLPVDFDRRFFNAASPGLIAPGYLRGDEEVVTVGASPQGRLAFRLPEEGAPHCAIELVGRHRAELTTVLDTVIVDMARWELTLQWRAYLPVRNGMGDIVTVEVTQPSA